MSSFARRLDGDRMIDGCVFPIITDLVVPWILDTFSDHAVLTSLYRTVYWRKPASTRSRFGERSTLCANEPSALYRAGSLNYLTGRRGLQTPGISRRFAVQVLLIRLRSSWDLEAERLDGK